MKKQLTITLLILVLLLSVLPMGAAAAEETTAPETEPTCYHLHSGITGTALPSCTQTGYSGDFSCEDCGEILLQGLEIPALPHTYEDGLCTQCGAEGSQERETEPTCYHLNSTLADTVTPSCTQTGYTGNLSCGDCGKTLLSGMEIPKLPHSYEDGVCTECGAEEAASSAEDTCYHLNSGIRNTVQRTCTQDGYTGDWICDACGKTLVTGVEHPAQGHSFEEGICAECGEADPDYVEPDVVRIAGSNRCATALKAANALKKTLGVEKFDVILYTDGKNFADALAGSYLAAQWKAPILLYLEGSSAKNLEYIRENLAQDGTVYILGGEEAVPKASSAALQLMGVRVQRLAGADRYETNLAILEEGSFVGGEVLVCASHTFADALSASATGLPILLVDEEWSSLNEAQRSKLESCAEALRFTILGGTAAVMEELEASLKAYGSVRRLGGQTRYETSILVAEEYFYKPARAVLAYSQKFPDGLCGGPLAYFMGAPLILTKDEKADIAAQYIAENGITKGAVMGGDILISDAAVDEIFGK